MKNPFGWILGFAWVLFWRVHKWFHPQGGSMWMPRWIQPYWMRCMGWEVNEGVSAFYRQERR